MGVGPLGGMCARINPDSNVTRAVYIHELEDADRRRGQRERIAGLMDDLA